MDAHLFRLFCSAACPLLTGARLAKVQEPAEGVLTFNFELFRTHPVLGRKPQLVFKSGRKDPFAFLSAARTSANAEPSAYVMRLRKYAAGRTVRCAVPDWAGRVLWLLMSGAMPGREQTGGDGAGTGGSGEARDSKLVWLCLSLREGARLCFLDENETPKPVEPAWPEAGSLASACVDWRAWPVLTPALRRTLKDMDQLDASALLADLEAGGGDVFLYAKAEPEEGSRRRPVVKVSCWPLSPEQAGGLVEEAVADPLEALMRAGGDLVLAEASRRAAQQTALPLVRREKRLLQLLARQDEETERLQKMLALGEQGRLLQSWLWQWPQDYRAGSVSVEGEAGPVAIALDPRFTLRENMERFFHQAKRAMRGFAHVEARRRELAGELKALRARLRETLMGGTGARKEAKKAQPQALPAEPPRRVQVFASSDGFTLLRGRDAKGNLEVRRLASPHDIWVHAEGGPGAHVIIRRSHGGEAVPERTLDEAGCLAALKSWLKDEPNALLTYCEVRHVKPMRGAALGTMRMDKVLFTRSVPVDPALEERLRPGSGGASAEPA